MAASGIAEHNEARRKEMSIQRNTFRRKNMVNNVRDHLGNNPDMVGASMDPNRDTYDEEVNEIRKVGSPPGIVGATQSMRHDAGYVDSMRRNQLRQQQICEYSAKIPNRYSSIDYAAQW